MPSHKDGFLFPNLWILVNHFGDFTALVKYKFTVLHSTFLDSEWNIKQELSLYMINSFGWTGHDSIEILVYNILSKLSSKSKDWKKN